MAMNTEDYLEMMEHLSRLTNPGRYYAGVIYDVAAMLYQEHLNKTKLSEEDKDLLFKSLVDTARKHKELIEQSIRERQEYLDSRREGDRSDFHTQ